MKKILMMMTLAVGLTGFAAQNDKFISFYTNGPDTYADGMIVVDGECYALVWVKTGATFNGFNADGSAADAENNAVLQISACAKDGRCAGVLFRVAAEQDAVYAGSGAYQVYLLDTRVNGLPSVPSDNKVAYVGAYGYCGDAARSEGVAALRKTLLASPAPEEPQPVLGLTRDDLPQAIVEIVDNGVVRSSEGYAMLCDPRDVNPDVELADPFTLDVTYNFRAFDAGIKKVVDAISPLLPTDKWECPDFKDMDAVNEATVRAVQSGAITTEEASAAGAFLDRVKPYWDWNCDFEVSFDRPVKKGTYVLAGRYEQAAKFGFNGWVCSAYENDLEPGETVRLLKDNHYKGVFVTYYEICSRVQEFLCGAVNLSEDNYGTAMTVKLCIYENTGNDDETGSRIEIGTYRYTFGGPLTVEFRNGLGSEGVRGGEITNPETITTNVAGREVLMLPTPTYDRAENKNIVFVGWSNQVDNTVLTYIPTNIWGPVTLYSTWTPAQTVEINQNPGDEQPTEIKVAQSWVDANVEEGKRTDTAAIQAELIKTDDNGNLKWQNYVAGIDPTAQVEGDAKQNAEEKTVKVVPENVVAPTADTGFKVSYSLDEVKTDGEVVAAGEPTTSDNLNVDLDSVDSNAFFKVNVIITKDDGTGEPTKIAAENTLGVLKVSEAPATSIVAVPWKDIGGADVTVDKLVKTATLTPGDKLYVYKADGKSYTTWNLEASGEWRTTGEGGEKADKTSVPRGSAVWLKRNDTSKPIVLFGQAEAEAVETTIEPAVTETEKNWNIVAAPTVEPVDLNEKFNETTKSDVAKDQVIVPTDGAPKNYTFENGKWGYTEVETIVVGGETRVKSKRVDNDAKVPAGTGFWYLNGGSETKVNW